MATATQNKHFSLRKRPIQRSFSHDPRTKLRWMRPNYVFSMIPMEAITAQPQHRQNGLLLRSCSWKSLNNESRHEQPCFYVQRWWERRERQTQVRATSFVQLCFWTQPCLGPADVPTVHKSRNVVMLFHHCHWNKIKVDTVVQVLLHLELITNALDKHNQYQLDKAGLDW